MFVIAVALVCCMNPDLLPLVSARVISDKALSDKSKPTTSELQNRFDHETNSVHKAKLFEKLSDEQLAEVRHASQVSDYNAVGTIMEKYRDNARAAVDALKKEHPNAEHQINGYKQLQIHIRRAIRDLKETVLLAPDEFKPPLQLVERDLALIDDELLQSLFPSPPQNTRSPEDQPIATNANPSANPEAQSPSGSALEQSPGGTSQAAPNASTESNPSTTPNAESGSQQSAASSVPGSQEKSDMNIQNCILTAVVTCGLAVATCGDLRAQFEQKDYLSPMESDKIRDAETTNDRLKLFVTFADDRLKKFQYELQHPSANRHGEMLNGLMNGYVGCLDDAADLMQLGIEKQENIRSGVDLINTKAKEFLEALNKIAADKVDIDIYKDNLDDAIEGTKDAITDSDKAKKSVAPPPVRRKS
ncbi:MAG TPA: hypothetical protein VN933_07110 [Candidatus Eremiobacteraceae bacterium]|nr:hypothetical protein [Candidatus Eremiobacteraceae bacterium]